jgi:hypothetical protein
MSYEWVDSLVGLSSEDVLYIQSWIDDACIDNDEFVEFVQEQSKELEKCIWELDLYSLCLEFIANEADVPELIPFLYNHGYETTFRVSPEEAGKIMAQVSTEDRNEAWFFILDFIEVDLPDEDEIDEDEIDG